MLKSVMIDWLEAGTMIIGVRPRPFFDCGDVAGCCTVTGSSLRALKDPFT